MPKASVIISTYNRASFLKDSLQSVVAQTYRDWELIVVDDGSTDDTAKVVSKYGSRINYIKKKNGGVSAARNTGIHVATGEFIAFLDDDDIWLSNYLEQQMKLMLQDPESDIVAGRCQVIDRNGKLLPNVFKPSAEPIWTPTKLLTSVMPVTSAVIIRKSAIERAGFFDETLKGDEDIHLYIRISVFARYRFNCEALVHYRKHGNNWTSNPIKTAEGYLIVCEKMKGLLPLLKNDAEVVQSEARTHYQLARLYLQTGKPFDGLRHVGKALQLQPAVGLLFNDQTLPSGFGWMRLVKPYGMALVLAFASLIQLFKKPMAGATSYANRN